MGVTIVIKKKGCFFNVSVLLYEFHGDNVHNEDDNGDGDDYHCQLIPVWSPDLCFLSCYCYKIGRSKYFIEWSILAILQY